MHPKGKVRLATFQSAITLYRDAGDTGTAAPTKQPPTALRLEEIIRDALVKEGYPDHRVSAMRTDI